MYLNTHKAYTGKGNHHTGKTELYTEQEELKIRQKTKENKRKNKTKNKSELHHTEALEVIMVKEKHRALDT